MKRRGFGLLAVVALASPKLVLAQGNKPWRVGLLYFGTRRSAAETGRYAAFLQGMRDAGHVEGRDFVMHTVYADGAMERLPVLAAEMIRLSPHVIVSTLSTMHRVMAKATSTIPIVMTVEADPLKDGLVKTLARPGGNITGLTSINAELSRKYFEVLADTIPRISRVGVLFSATNVGHPDQLKNLKETIAAFRATANAIGVRVAPDLAAAAEAFVRWKADAAVVLADGLFVENARQLAELAAKHRLPFMYPTSEHPDAGGLMSYGADIRLSYRRAAYYVDRIMKGAKPADLPIEQPSKFELVINLRAAKHLGLDIPQRVLFRADRVIE
jgi:putative tryptophan/tyrosine transport system substrate-binding protein